MAKLGAKNVGAGTRWGRQSTKECPHTKTLVTITAGLERIVCEACGHLSFRYLTALSGPVERERFARPIDLLERSEPPLAEPNDSFEVFARHEQFHIRSRYEAHPQTSGLVV